MSISKRSSFKLPTIVLIVVIAAGLLPAISTGPLRAEAAFAADASAASVSAGWKECGTCEWRVDGEGTLTIRPLGNGASGTLANPEWEGDWWSGSYVFPWGNDTSIKSLKVQKGVRANTSLSGFCAGLENLTSADLSGLDTSATTNMAQMFVSCHSLTTLDLSNFNTANVTDMDDMFASCKSLTSVNVSSFDTSNVEYLYGMFYHCEKLKSVDLSHFKTSKVTSTRNMFLGCYSIVSIDVSGFDTSNVTNMSGMFGDIGYYTIVLESITVGDKFVFATDSDGTRQEAFPSLPEEYTGKWISSVDGKRYEANEIPNNVAATYTAEKYPVSSLTGVSLGPGLVAAREVTINQVGAKEEALAAITRWRQDALDDTSIKFSSYDEETGETNWLTTREYLAKNGMTEEEYLNPKWSNTAERWAIQRGIEAGGHYELTHTRPNGNGGEESVLAGGGGSPSGAIDLWASEKSAYVEYVKDGQDHGVTGHYTWIIWPGSRSFGVGGSGAWAGVSGAWAGVSGSSDDEDSATNLSGTFEAEVAFSDDKVAEGVTWSGPASVGVGHQGRYYAYLNYDSRYFVKGTWSSSDTSIATVDDDGYVTGVSTGQATITVTAITGASFSTTVNVETMHSVRLAGNEADETSASISSTAFESSRYAILARMDDFADAMSATGLAGALDCPIILTNRYGLSESAKSELQRLGVTNVYIIGGTGAMPGDFESQLTEALGEYTVTYRIYGTEYYDTSVACAEWIWMYGGDTSKAIVAYGQNFQDALSISSYAYKYHVPIFLQTPGATSAERALPQEALDMLNGVSSGAYANAAIYVPGGPGAVSTASVEGVFGDDLRGGKRIYGETGYDTSNALANYFTGTGELSASTVCIATGAEAAKGVDALAGAALAGRAGGVMLLASAQGAMEAENHTAIDDFLANNSEEVSNAYILGGTYVLPDAFKSKVDGLLAG